MSNSNSISPHHTDINQDFGGLSQMIQNPLSVHAEPPQKAKKKRNLPGNPDPDAEVIALSPKSLLATNRFVCEICNKGFQRDQNLQLHRRGHNLPWKLRQTRSKENKKRAYVCPELSCVHHDPSRALGDLTGIKKHYCRKHGEKKWKCDKCTKIYAVKSDWKAHSKACGTKEYKCDCGSIFPRKDSYITHKAFCEALSKENGKISTAHITHSMPSSSLFPPNPNTNHTAANHPQLLFGHPNLPPPPPITNSFAQFSPFNNRRFPIPYWDPTLSQNPNNPNILVAQNLLPVKHEPLYQERSFLPPLSATALLHRAMGSVGPSMGHADAIAPATWRATCGGLTRDFLGLTGEQCDGDGGSGGSTGTAAPGFPQCDRDGPVFGG